MKIKYNFEKGRLHDVCGNPEYETEEFIYEVNEVKLKDALEELFMDEFDTTLKQTTDIIEEFDLWEELEKRYEYGLKEYFEEEALEEYNESQED